jgi:hypothetical protein
MASRVTGQAGIIRGLQNLERRAHGAARKAVGETTRAVQLGIRAEVNSIFRKNRKAGNAIRSVVYANEQSRRPAGIVFSAFGRREGGRWIDYLLPYITGRPIVPRHGKYLAVPLQKGKRNRKPRPDMDLAAVRSGGRLYLVKHSRTRSLFMFVLVKRIPITRRLRAAAALLRGGAKLPAEIIRQYRALGNK